MQETSEMHVWVRFLGWKDTLKEGMVTHSSVCYILETNTTL